MESPYDGREQNGGKKIKDSKEDTQHIVQFSAALYYNNIYICSSFSVFVEDKSFNVLNENYFLKRKIM